MKKLRDQGRAVVFISHKMDEVMQLAGRVTVLAHGRNKACVETKDSDKKSLARLMNGHRSGCLRVERREAGNSARRGKTPWN